MFAILLSERMDPFYQNISSFPTVFFTFVLLITMFYWLIAVLGFIDIEVLDLDIEGADINADSASAGPDALAGLMLKFGLYGVPVTVIISFIALFGWFLCYYQVYLLFDYLPEGILRVLAGIPVLFVSLYAGVMITAQVIKPLRVLFEKTSQKTIKHVLGQTAVVRTSKVDEHYGEAKLEDGGAGLILKVRASEGKEYAYQEKVVLLEYREAENVYRVVSEEEFKNI